MNDILVVGAGSIGRRHITCLKELGVKNVYVCEPVKEVREIISKIFDLKEIFESLDAAFQHHYDAAVVCVPNYLHAEVACQILERKIPVLLEKPIEISLKAAQRIKKVVDDNKVICQIAYCLRFDPGVQKMHEIINSEKLGKIYSVDIHVGHFLPDWRAGVDYRQLYSAKKREGGGVCLDLSHEFDYLRFLFGEPQNVTAIVAKLSELEIDVEDIAEALIVLQRGAIARIHLDYLSHSPKRQIYIIAEHGTIQYNFVSSTLTSYLRGNECNQFQSQNNDRNVVYVKQLQHFFESIKSGADPLVTVDDAIRTLELSLKVRSFWNQG